MSMKSKISCEILIHNTSSIQDVLIKFLLSIVIFKPLAMQISCLVSETALMHHPQPLLKK